MSQLAKKSSIIETIPSYEEFRKDLELLEIKTKLKDKFQGLNSNKDTDDIINELSGLVISKSPIVVKIEDHDRMKQEM